ncbi:MAG: PAP/fibrillin family protein [Deltaproteobacteria bacterium]|jgi:hypothetical protein|nr:PAP/fibrillin family protein [Deltaproteobacteria bacterium]
MYRTLFKTLPLAALALAGCVSDADPAATAAEDLIAEAADLPGPDGIKADQVGALTPALRGFLKSYVVTVAEANTTNRDNLEQVRKVLLPAIALLAEDFAANRPANELEITRGIWKGIWDDSPSISDTNGPFTLDRDNVFQVVEEGYYYNVSNQSVQFGPGPAQTTHSFLKGLYAVARPAGPDNAGELALNAIDLEFDETVFRPGPLPTDVNLRDMVVEIDEWVTTGQGQGIPPNPSPGPKGRTGFLFNLYVDDGLRIAGGFDGEENPEFLQIFILRRAETATPLAPYQP